MQLLYGYILAQDSIKKNFRFFSEMTLWPAIWITVSSLILTGIINSDRVVCTWAHSILYTPHPKRIRAVGIVIRNTEVDQVHAVRNGFDAARGCGCPENTRKAFEVPRSIAVIHPVLKGFEPADDGILHGLPCESLALVMIEQDHPFGLCWNMPSCRT